MGYAVTIGILYLVFVGIAILRSMREKELIEKSEVIKQAFVAATDRECSRCGITISAGRTFYYIGSSDHIKQNHGICKKCAEAALE